MVVAAKGLNSILQTYYYMASKSKEENVLELILGTSPLKEWHFEEIVREAKVTRAVANKWLRKYVEEGLLKRIKQKGSFPYFTAGLNNETYQSRKKFHAIEHLYKSGLIQQLLQLKNAKTVIIFGSLIKGDWYKDSDIDIFIFGNADDFNKKSYELKLGRNIELQVFENREEMAEVKTGLMDNVFNGYVVKGRIQDISGVA